MFTPRPYQLPAAEYLITRKRGMVQSPAGSGKTIIAALALDMVLRSRPRTETVKVGWLANTQEQCAQAISALALFPSISQWAEVKVACAAAQTDWSDRKLLIVDECHHVSTALGWQKQIDKCEGAIWGLTATPPDEMSEFYGVFVFYFGDNWHVIERKEVGSNLAHAKVVLLSASDFGVEDKINAEVEATMRWRRKYWRGGEGELWGQVCFQCIIEHGIVNNRARNQAAIDTVKRHASQQVLMLVNQVEHAGWMASQLPNAVACFSKMGKKKREAALEAFKRGEVKCIVATSLADEGLDLPNAGVLVMVSGGRSKRLAEQRTGRVLRSFAGKTHGLIYDFTDELVHPLAAKQSRARQDVYRELGYEFAN